MDSPVEHLHVRRHNLSLVLRLFGRHTAADTSVTAEEVPEPGVMCVK